MAGRRFANLLLRSAVVLALLAQLASPPLADKKETELEVPFEPTPPQVVEEMLKLANVTAADIVYDLGCGDGRIVIAAAKKRQARGFGVDLDPQRIEECKENAEAAGVTDRVQFKLGDIMDQDLSSATVVTLYLLDEVNLMLRPKLFRELRPGTRIVSHAFHMSDWQSDDTVGHPKARNDIIYLWIVPAPVGGIWEWTAKTNEGEFKCELALRQLFQRLEGDLKAGELPNSPISEASLEGRDISFSAVIRHGGRSLDAAFKGIADGDTIRGAQYWKQGEHGYSQEWVARRRPFDLAGSWPIKVTNSPEPLDGLLQLVHNKQSLAAYYAGYKDKKAVDLPNFISWGTSIYFRIRVDEKPIVFFGSLDGALGSGKVSRTGWTKDATWTAQRSK